MRRQHVTHPGHDEAMLVPEAAGAVAEPALVRGEDRGRERVAVDHADVGNRGRDLLPVGADVLDRRAADQTGNAGQALEAGAVGRHCLRHEGVPRLPGAGGEYVAVRLAFHVYAADVHVDDQTGEPLVGNHHVAAAAQHVHRLPALPRPPQCLDEVLLAAGMAEPARRAADSQGAPVGERDIGLNGHARDACSTSRSSGRSRAMRAAAASWREQNENSMTSPGASWPARGRSALMTHAIFG